MSTSPTSSFAHLDKDNVHKQKTFSDVNDLVAWYKTNDVKEETRAFAEAAHTAKLEGRAMREEEMGSWRGTMASRRASY